MKTKHTSEHITFPAHKMIERSYLKNRSNVYQITKNQKKLIKKTHTKRSRNFLKQELNKSNFENDNEK